MMKFARRAAQSAVALMVLVAAAWGANDLVFSFGTTWTPTGPALFQGRDFQTLTDAVNTIRDQIDGTGTGITVEDLAVDDDATVGDDLAVTGDATVTGTLGVTGAITPTGGIAAAGGYAVSCRVFYTGNEPAIATTSGTNLDIVTTETYRAEIFVPATCSSTGVAIFNGTAVAGNVQAYLITAAGAQVTGVLTASTAQSGTTAYQLIPWAGGPYTIVGPATYYIAVQGNNTGGDLRTHVVGTFGADKQTGTTYGALTVAAAPTTFTTGVGPIASLY